MWVKLYEKKNINFSSLRPRYNRLTNRKKLLLPLENASKVWRTWSLALSVWDNGVKLWAFDEYPRVFPDKVTYDIDFTDEVVVQCDVPDVKILF